MADSQIHTDFIRFGREAMNRTVFVGRYILMPDHIHLFVKVPPPVENLSGWVKSLKNFLSKCLRVEGVSAPHWQKGFFDHLLRSGESYASKWLYMAENPIRAGLVKNWPDWPYQGEIYPLERR